MSYIDPRNPNVQKFRAARELKRRKAIKRQEIKAQNPTINPKMLERVVEAQIIQEDARAEAERQANRPKGRPRKWDSKPPQVTHANQALRQSVRAWKSQEEQQGKRFLPYYPAAKK